MLEVSNDESGINILKPLGCSTANRGGIWVLDAKTITEEHKWPIRVKKAHHHFAQFIVLDRLGHIVIEPCASSIFDLFAHGVRGKSHDGYLRVMVALFPVANFFAGFIAILDGHLDVAL